jgi:arylsulfatase
VRFGQCQRAFAAQGAVFEIAANRGIYADGWYANTIPAKPPWDLGAGPVPSVWDYRWELYNIAQDYSQSNDLAAKMPAELKQMQAPFAQEARKYGVYPLDNRAFARAITPRPSTVAGKTVFTYTGGDLDVPDGNAPSILNKSFTITAEITVAEGGAEGMIVTDGGRFGGYGLYLLRGRCSSITCSISSARAGKAAWEYSTGWAIRSSRASTRSSSTSPMKGPASPRAGPACSGVDGRDFATKRIEHTIAFLLPPDESFNVGMDTRTKVDFSYDVPFRFTGTINEVTFKLGPMQLSERGAAEDGESDRRRAGLGAG